MGTTNPIRGKRELEKFKNYYLEKEKYRNYLLIIMGLNTALRISDILKLRWNDVYDFQNKRYRSHICLVEQKTGKKTMIAVNHSLHEALVMCCKDRNEEDFLFCTHSDPSHAIDRMRASTGRRGCDNGS